MTNSNKIKQTTKNFALKVSITFPASHLHSSHNHSNYSRYVVRATR